MHSFTSFAIQVLLLGAQSYAAPTNDVSLVERNNGNVRISLSNHKISWGYESDIAATMGRIRQSCEPAYCSKHGTHDFTESLMAIKDASHRGPMKTGHVLTVKPVGSFASEESGALGLRHQMVTMALIAMEEAVETVEEGWHDSLSCFAHHCDTFIERNDPVTEYRYPDSVFIRVDDDDGRKISQLEVKFEMASKDSTADCDDIRGLFSNINGAISGMFGPLLSVTDLVCSA